MPRINLTTSIPRLAIVTAIAASMTGLAALWPSAADGGGAMHVGDLDATASRKSSWQAKVTITVHDASDKPVAGATVGAAWGGGASGTARCKTGRQGTCTVTSPAVAPGATQVTLRMLGMSANGLTYDASANHDPDGSSDGTTVVVSK